MNPRLVKFAVELQNGGKQEEKPESFTFKSNGGGGGKKWYIFSKPVRVTIPIDRN